jgi:transcriptional regulator of acetoin/glycerol metabolism
MAPKDVTERGLREALKAAKGNASAAARQLGISRPSLYRLMAKHGVTIERLVA